MFIIQMNKLTIENFKIYIIFLVECEFLMEAN